MVKNMYDIIFIISGWDSIKQRPHQIVNAALRTNYNPVVLTWGKSIKKIFKKDEKYIIRAENMLKANFFRTIKGEEYKKKALENLINNFNFKNKLIIYESPPIINIDKTVFEKNFIIYDCMDEWSEFNSSLYNKEIEMNLLKYSKKVVCVTEGIKNRLKNIYKDNDKYSVVSNGCVVEDFKQNFNSAKNVIYFGSVYDWFDWQKVIAIACEDENVKIKIVGPCKNYPKNLPKNIKIYGEKRYIELPSLIYDCKIGIIPFKNVNRKFLEGISTIKLYEYLASNLIVLSSSLPDSVKFKEEGIVHIADRVEDFVLEYKNIKNITDNEYLKMKRKRIAYENSWDQKFKDIIL